HTSEGLHTIGSEEAPSSTSSNLSLVSSLLTGTGILTFVILVTLVGKRIQLDLFQAFKSLISLVRVTLYSQRPPQPGDIDETSLGALNTNTQGPEQRSPFLFLINNTASQTPLLPSMEATSHKSPAENDAPTSAQSNHNYNTLATDLEALRGPHMETPVTRLPRTQLSLWSNLITSWFLHVF
ncbi:hypothetical protein FRC02_007764, partial [Tulasnella sp. 418]